MNISLYQFALSHYCEKARWALDYKGLKYQTINLVPGPHIWTIRRLAAKTSVPLLKHDKTVVQDSTKIIDYLDSVYPDKNLSPRAVKQNLEALEMEEYLDQEVGPHLRRFFYYHVLPNRKLAESLLLQQAPAYGRYLYAVIFPMVRLMMKKSMNIQKESAARSEKKLTAAIDRLNKILSTQNFLVGNAFSRADVTAASLLAPLCMPPEHQFKWPKIEDMPAPLVAYKNTHGKDPVFDYVLRMYRDHRRC